MPKQAKVFKIMIEIPEKWIDADSPILWTSPTLRAEVRRVIKDAWVEQVLKTYKLPKIVISPKEIKKAIIDYHVARVSDRIIQNAYENDN